MRDCAGWVSGPASLFHASVWYDLDLDGLKRGASFVFCVGFVFLINRVGWPGGDLLFRGLSRSTIGAAGLYGRVRDGIGCFPRAMATRPTHTIEVRCCMGCTLLGVCFMRH